MKNRHFRMLNPRLDSSTVKQNEPANQFDGEKGIRYDINCVLADGTTAQVEMQEYDKKCEYVTLFMTRATVHRCITTQWLTFQPFASNNKMVYIFKRSRQPCKSGLDRHHYRIRGGLHERRSCTGGIERCPLAVD